MSDFDFLRIDKSSGKSLLRLANTQGYASSSINISVVKYRGFLPSPGVNFISRFSLDSSSVSKEPGLMGRSSLVSSQSSISFNNSSRSSKSSSIPGTVSESSCSSSSIAISQGSSFGLTI